MSEGSASNRVCYKCKHSDNASLHWTTDRVLCATKFLLFTFDLFTFETFESSHLVFTVHLEAHFSELSASLSRVI